MREAAIVGLAIGLLVVLVCLPLTRANGDLTAYREYRACLRAREFTKSDSVTVAVRPECKRWLFPEVQ